MANKAGCENTHKACENHKVGVKLVNFSLQRSVEIFAASELLVIDTGCSYTSLLGANKTEGVGLVTYNSAYFCVGQLLVFAGVDKRLQIGAAAR